MLILIDSANIETIRRLYDKFPCNGVTTNPTILKKEKQNPMEQLKRIRAFLPKDSELHAQVISTRAEDMVREAHHILENLGEETYIKVPVSDEGIKAMKLMSRNNIKITATAIYTPMQAFIAGKAGANYAAPYVNRMDNIGADGVQVAKDIHTIFTVHKLKTIVLAASFKNTQQILELCKFGIGSITAAPEVVEQLIRHPVTNIAVTDFNNDFTDLCGEGKTMLDF